VSEFSTRFPIRGLGALPAALGVAALARLGRLNEVRRGHAEHLTRALAGLESVELLRPAAGSEPVFLRLPLLLKGPAERSHAYGALRRLGASPMYPHAVADILDARPYLAARRSCPQAADVARRILALPTHPLTTTADREEIIHHLRNGAGA
jgi:perosamine synthetase